MRTNQTESSALTTGSLPAGSRHGRTGTRFRRAPVRPSPPAGQGRCWQAKHLPACSRPDNVPACRPVAADGAAVLPHSWDNGQPGDRGRRRHRRCTRKSRSAPRSNPAADRNRNIRSSVAVQAWRPPKMARHSSMLPMRAPRSASARLESTGKIVEKPDADIFGLRLVNVAASYCLVQRRSIPATDNPGTNSANRCQVLPAVEPGPAGRSIQRRREPLPPRIEPSTPRMISRPTCDPIARAALLAAVSITESPRPRLP